MLEMRMAFGAEQIRELIEYEKSFQALLEILEGGGSEEHQKTLAHEMINRDYDTDEKKRELFDRHLSAVVKDSDIIAACIVQDFLFRSYYTPVNVIGDLQVKGCTFYKKTGRVMLQCMDLYKHKDKPFLTEEEVHTYQSPHKDTGTPKETGNTRSANKEHFQMGDLRVLGVGTVEHMGNRFFYHCTDCLNPDLHFYLPEDMLNQYVTPYVLLKDANTGETYFASKQAK